MVDPRTLDPRFSQANYEAWSRAYNSMMLLESQESQRYFAPMPPPQLATYADRVRAVMNAQAATARAAAHQYASMAAMNDARLRAAHQLYMSRRASPFKQRDETSSRPYVPQPTTQREEEMPPPCVSPGASEHFVEVAYSGPPPERIVSVTPDSEKEEEEPRNNNKRERPWVEPPAAGTVVEIETYPNNDTSQQAAWFRAVVVSSEEDRVEVRYEDPEWPTDTLSWPKDSSDLRVVTDDSGSPLTMVVTPPKKQKEPRKKRKATPRKSRRTSSVSVNWMEIFKENCEVDVDEVSHMIQFFLCQLRAEYAEIIAATSTTDRCSSSHRPAYDEFDEAVQALEGNMTTSSSLVSCEPLMETFLLGRCAKGDKWMPWHCALGTHERYLLEVVSELPLLESGREKYVLGFAFSGSREIELFEAILRPLFEDTASESDRNLGRQVLWNSKEAFKRNGIIHQRYVDYRKTGKKLHTTAYQCHPPKGSAGDEFVFYVVDRTRRFVDLGHRAYDLIKPVVEEATTIEEDSGKSGDLRRRLSAVFMSAHEIGPTMTKMFLVSTHLAYPEARILDDDCAVGDGADAAFDFLFPSLPPRPKALSRGPLLAKLHDHLLTSPLFPRFSKMLQWVATKARDRFSSADSKKIPISVLSKTVTPYDLQVNLCEWRKFRNAVDPHRIMASDRILDETLLAEARINYNHPKNKKRKQQPGAILFLESFCASSDAFVPPLSSSSSSSPFLM